MSLDSFLNDLNSRNVEYRENEKMSNHTTFKIGGAADVFVIPNTAQKLLQTVKSAQKNNVECFFIGKGSNLLVSDGGINGAVISLSCLDRITLNGEKLVCSAGASLARICTFAQENGLSGMEFAYGIPGSIGGALFMNAGAYGGEMSQIVSSAVCMDKDGETFVLPVEDMKLGYRESIFKTNGMLITEVTVTLKKDNKSAIKERMDDFIFRRKSKQPLEYPSAGSTFKRPAGNFAGALIEKNNLKGMQIGGAQVSEKHAGFIINKCGATCKDVLALIEKVKETVFENDNVMLEPEVIFVGRKQ